MQVREKQYVSTAKRPKMPIWPIVFSMKAFTYPLMSEVAGKKFSEVLMLVKDGTCEYFLYQDEIDILSNSIDKKIEKDSLTTKKFLSRLLKRGEDLLVFSKSIDINQSDKSLIHYLEKYEKFYKRLIVLGWPLAITGEAILTKKIKDYLSGKILNHTEREKVFGAISSPLFQSYTNKEKVALIKLAIKFQNEAEAQKGLKRHWKKYQWIYFDYTGPAHTIEYFSKRLNGLFKEKKNLQKRLKELMGRDRAMKLIQKKILRKYKFDKSILIKINALQDLIYIRDKKKEIFTEVHFKMESLLNEISRRTRINKEYLRWLMTEEFRKLLKCKKIDLKKIKQRIKYSAVLCNNGKVKILLSDKARKYFNLTERNLYNLKEIKGVCACPGKITGKIRIIKKAEYGGKLKRGEILVTTMTTIDFVPVIKKSSAIITDEGGVTSHAAIVSREFKIPCVIGTKIATRILRDGQVVEVDAEKGIVRILNKKG